MATASLAPNLVPSGDWELNILMLRIARELEDDDFQSMKFLCSGQKGVPQGVLERLSTPQKFFTYLREKGMLSRDNLVLLQAFLWHVGRLDLHQLAADYARKMGNVLHFFAPNTEPESGYEHVKFHVAGDLDTFQRRELEDMRINIARLMFVPPEFVFLCGLEPANSLFLTFMIHSFCAQILKDLATSSGGQDLRKLGIDIVYFREEEIHVRDMPEPERRCSVVELELGEMYRRTQDLEQRVQQLDLASLNAREEREDTERRLVSIQDKETYYRGLLCAALDTQQKGSDPSQDGNTSTTHLPLCLENGRFVI